MKRFIFLIALCAALTMQAAPSFVSFSPLGGGALQLTGSNDTVRFDPQDDSAVRMAVASLRADLQAVTGSQCAPIIVGTAGKSRAVARYKSVARMLKGKWEQYVIFTDKGRLVIMGSDRRGTVYGIYELSRQIGVSPWYWWADAPIARHDHIYIKNGEYSDGEPAVHYRGLFINDEWPSFGGWASKHFGGVNAKMYAHLFELLLRLKANYFWPAMWSSAFNEDDPACPALANAMGIVMGTSHHEPMMRSHKEYTSRRNEVGPWDYKTNKERVDQFFREGMERNKAYDNLVTIGMRGDGDTAMGKGDDEDNIRTLKDVVEGQRKIIKNIYGRPDAVPQLWAIFTEVQRYYDAGFTVPDDVTLLFCDNNWGYIRRAGTEKERARSGGLGLYYHIDMNGGPWNDRWVNTTTLPKLREQLHLAYASGIDRIWIVNVGDLKPKEVPIDFIMNYAWNPNAIGPGDEQPWQERFSESIFGKEEAAPIARLMASYSKMNLWRKPEVQHPGLMNEAEMRLTDSLWNEVEREAETLRARLPKEAQSAFYQLAYYPAVASAGVAHIYNLATHGDSLGINRLMKRDEQLTAYYNDTLSNGKWSGYMQDKHIGYTHWAMPERNVNPLAIGMKPAVSLAALSDKPTTECALSATDFVAQSGWQLLPGLGRGKGCMGAKDVMKAEAGAYLEYEIHTDSTGLIAIGILPTQDIRPERGLRIGVEVDGGETIVVDARQGMHDEFSEYTPQNLARTAKLHALPQPSGLALSGFWNGKQLPVRSDVFDNLRWLAVNLGVGACTHRLRLVMIDPEIVVERIVVNPDNSRYSYFGGMANGITRY